MSCRLRVSRTSVGVRLRLRQLLLKGLLGEVALGLVVGRFDVALGHLDLQGARLRDQNLLHDEVVEQTELGGERLLGRHSWRRGAIPPEGLLHILPRDVLAADHGPRVG